MKFQTLALAWLLLAAVAQAETLTKDDPDVTEDGLVRVPSHTPTVRTNSSCPPVGIACVPKW